MECPKCGNKIDYSFMNKCDCGCVFIVAITEKGCEIIEQKENIKYTPCGTNTILFNGDVYEVRH